MGKLYSSTWAEVDPRLEVEMAWWKDRTREGHEGGYPQKIHRRLGEEAAAPAPAPAIRG